MKWTPPVTPDGWESKLIDYFLRFGTDGDAQDTLSTTYLSVG